MHVGFFNLKHTSRYPPPPRLLLHLQNPNITGPVKDHRGRQNAVRQNSVAWIPG